MGGGESGELEQQAALQSDHGEPAREWEEEASVGKNPHATITPIKQFINICKKKRRNTAMQR